MHTGTDFPLRSIHSPLPSSGIGVTCGAVLSHAMTTAAIEMTNRLLAEVACIPAHEVHVLRKLGEGGYAEVSLASVEGHGEVAVKSLKV